jgi:hypothetical protein
MVCDAIIGVQKGLLWFMPLSFMLIVVVPALEAVAAGSLWRRYQRPWRVTLAYLERIVPLAMALMLGAIAVWVAVWFRALIGAGWIGVYERAYWPVQVALALVIVPQIAAWREWPVWLRLLLTAGWIVLAGFARYCADDMTLAVITKLRLP